MSDRPRTQAETDADMQIARKSRGLIIQVRAGETLIIDDVALTFDRKVRVTIKGGPADITFPNGRTSWASNQKAPANV
jgi:hypothetical protein